MMIVKHAGDFRSKTKKNNYQMSKKHITKLFIMLDNSELSNIIPFLFVQLGNNEILIHKEEVIKHFLFFFSQNKGTYTCIYTH